MLGVSQIHVGNDVHDPAVGLLGQALVLAAVAGFHVEDGDVQPLGGNGGQAGVGIAQNQQGIGLQLPDPVFRLEQNRSLGNVLAHRLLVLRLPVFGIRLCLFRRLANHIHFILAEAQSIPQLFLFQILKGKLRIRTGFHIFPLFSGNQDLTGFTTLERTNNALFFHLINDTSRAGITKFQSALQHRNRSLFRLKDHVHRCRQHLIAVHLIISRFRSCLSRLAVTCLNRLTFNLFHDVLIIFCHKIRLHIGCYCFNFTICDKATLHTLGFTVTNRRIKHITLTDEEDIPDAIGKLRTIYHNLMELRYDNKRTRAGHKVIEGASDARSKNPLELFGELYSKQNGDEMDTVQKEYLMEMISKIWEN